MGFASIIATALGIILLIVTAYVLVSGVLVASETVVEAQKDMTAIQVERIGTSIDISVPSDTEIIIHNIGSEIIRDLDKMDVYMRSNESGPWTLYHQSTHWSVVGGKNMINPNRNITITHSIGSPYEVKIVTPNGISDCAFGP